MREIPKNQVLDRIRFENPWWDTAKIDVYYGRMARRAYFELFEPLVRDVKVKRAVVLMGPRRVGKTVLIYQMIQVLIDSGISPTAIAYISLENPVYNGLGLEALVADCRAITEAEIRFVFFDEIQYLPSWEIHLKSMVDSYHDIKFVASGSAAAALKLKSIESGAGRFTDFLLPPLTFHEYLELAGQGTLVSYPANTDPGESGDEDDDQSTWAETSDIDTLNKQFVDYLNFGGYPEAVVSKEVRSNPGRFIRNDIIDKVLLRDLPSLYGIEDIQELNSLFTMLAFNTAQEVSLEQLSQKSGVAKNTIKRYITYLEAAFLIKRVNRVDRNAKRFQRATAFKVYLTTPSIRSALFLPVREDSGEMGSLVETAIFAQWFHSHVNRNVCYARWASGEVDLVYLSDSQEVVWAVEAKWSDRMIAHSVELSPLIEFSKAHQLKRVLATTRSERATKVIDGVSVALIPASLYCYTVGHNVVRSKKYQYGALDAATPPVAPQPPVVVPSRDQETTATIAKG